MAKPSPLGTGVAAIVSALAFVGLMVAFISPDPGKREAVRIPFNATGWKTGKPDDGGMMWPTRQRMAYDLLSGRLKGWTREQVIALLGKSEDYSSLPPGALSYILGQVGDAFGPNCETLTVEFGPDGKVSRVRTETRNI